MAALASTTQLCKCLNCVNLYSKCELEGPSCPHPVCHDCLLKNHCKCLYCFKPHHHLIPKLRGNDKKRRQSGLLRSTPQGNHKIRASTGDRSVLSNHAFSIGQVSMMEQMRPLSVEMQSLASGIEAVRISPKMVNNDRVFENSRDQNNRRSLGALISPVGHGFNAFVLTQGLEQPRWKTFPRTHQVTDSKKYIATHTAPRNKIKSKRNMQEVSNMLISAMQCDFTLDCKTPVKYVCKVCVQNLCALHLWVHLMSGQDTKDHIVIPIEQPWGDSEYARSDWAVAQTHHAECSFPLYHTLYQFCVQCQELLCVMCKIACHRGHILQDVDVAAAQCRQVMASLCYRGNEFKEELAKAKTAAENMVFAVERRRQENINVIEKWVQDICQMVYEKAQKAKELNELVVTQKMRVLLQQKEDLNLMSETVETYEIEAREAIQCMPDSSLLSFHVIASKELMKQTYEGIHLLRKPIDDDIINIDFHGLSQVPKVLLTTDIKVTTNNLAYLAHCFILPEGDLWKSGLLKNKDNRIVSCEFAFTLYLRNHVNESCAIGFDSVVVYTELSSHAYTDLLDLHPRKKQDNCQITALPDGQYNVLLSFNEVGVYLVAILINGVPWPKPFQLRVYNGGSYLYSPIATIVTTDLNRAWGISTDKKGLVYVADRSDCTVKKFDSNGSFLMQFGGPGQNLGEFQLAMKVAINDKGIMYVTDKENNRIQVFNEDGTNIGVLGDPKELKLHFPWDIKINDNGDLAVTDTRNDRVLLLNAHGHVMQNIGIESNKNLKEPRGVCFLRNGDMVVSAFQSHEVMRIDSNFKFLRAFCAPLNEYDQRTLGSFNRPSGITQDQYGNVIIADTKNNRLQVYSEDGNFITAMGPQIWVKSIRGLEEVMMSAPSDVALSPDGKILWVLDGDDELRRLLMFANFM